MGMAMEQKKQEHSNKRAVIGSNPGDKNEHGENERSKNLFLQLTRIIINVQLQLRGKFVMPKFQHNCNIVSQAGQYFSQDLALKQMNVDIKLDV